MSGGRLPALVALGAALAASAAAQPPPRPLPEEGDYLYRALPDVSIVDAHGDARPLHERWQQRPLLLTLVFSTCVGGCPAYVRTLRDAAAETGRVGEDYDVLVLSFDPRDTPESMAALARRHGLEAAPGWSFAVAAPRDVERLARAIGFWSVWDEGRSQFDHPTLLAAVVDGRVLRLLVGTPVSRHRLREVLWELRGVLVPTYPLPAADVRFRCFDIDPATGAYRPDWGLALLLAPGFGMLAGALLIFGFRPSRPPEGPAPATAASAAPRDHGIAAR